jgi:hypothetical protein
MRQKIYIKFVSAVLAVMVLFSSIGLTINAHYCHTSGQIKKSILPVSLYCDHDEAMVGCALPQTNDEIITCCATESSAEAVHSEDCCEDYNTFLKLLSEFDLPVLKISFNLFLQFVLSLFDLILPSAAKDLAELSQYHDPPPLIYGKQLLLAYNQLKIDPATL